MRRLVSLLLGLVVTAVLASTPAHAASRLIATFSLSGNTGKFVVANPGTTAVSGWSIIFDLPAGVTVSNAQHATTTQTGTRVSPVKTTRTVTLAWTAATPGSLPITGYEVYGGPATVTTTGTSATVTGLNPNTAYTFTVKAKDRKGTLSAASAALNVRTNNPADDTQPPSVPGNPRSTARTSGSVTLAWTASTDNTGVAGYDVLVGGTGPPRSSAPRPRSPGSRRPPNT